MEVCRCKCPEDDNFTYGCIYEVTENGVRFATVIDKNGEENRMFTSTFNYMFDIIGEIDEE